MAPQDGVDNAKSMCREGMRWHGLIDDIFIVIQDSACSNIITTSRLFLRRRNKVGPLRSKRGGTAQNSGKSDASERR